MYIARASEPQPTKPRRRRPAFTSGDRADPEDLNLNLGNGIGNIIRNDGRLVDSALRRL